MASKRKYVCPNVGIEIVSYDDVMISSGEQLDGCNTNGYDNELDLLGGGTL